MANMSWLSAWPTEWLWLYCLPVCMSVCWFFDWMSWLINWLIDWWIDSPANYFLDWLSDTVADGWIYSVIKQSEWQTWLNDWFSASANARDDCKDAATDEKSELVGQNDSAQLWNDSPVINFIEQKQESNCMIVSWWLLLDKMGLAII